jgi:glutaredoxin
MRRANEPVTLTLLSRAYCHLCDDMRAALAALACRHGIDVVEVDVDAHPPLEARYGDLVPVLFAGDPHEGVELSRYVLDAARVEAAIARGPPE